MKYASKLDINAKWLGIDPNKFKGIDSVKHGSLGDEFALEIKHLPEQYSKYLLGFLPNQLHLLATTVTFTHIKHAYPHIHTGDKCVVNFYKETNGAPTIFWGGLVEREESNDAGNGYYNCKKEFLTETERFVAQPGDVWLFNTKVAHSVLDVKNNSKRTAYQIYFDTSYEEVFQVLNDWKEFANNEKP